MILRTCNLMNTWAKSSFMLISPRGIGHQACAIQSVVLLRLNNGRKYYVTFHQLIYLPVQKAHTDCAHSILPARKLAQSNHMLFALNSEFMIHSMDTHECLACFRTTGYVSGENVKRVRWQFGCIVMTGYGSTCNPQLQSMFSSCFAVKNCSYFKHFTSGEEAEVFEVKTQKGKVSPFEIMCGQCKGFHLSRDGGNQTKFAV